MPNRPSAPSEGAPPNRTSTALSSCAFEGATFPRTKAEFESCVVFVEEVGGGENGLGSWASFEVTTDPNGSEFSSGPEPKSEAASCTVLISSYPRRFPRDAVGARKKQSGGLERKPSRWGCAEEIIAFFTGCPLACPPVGSRNYERAVEKGRNGGDVCVMARSPNSGAV